MDRLPRLWSPRGEEAVTFLFYLALTTAAEGAVLARPLGGFPPRRAVDLIAINALTQPLATLAVVAFSFDWWAVEAGVLAIEALLFRHLLGLAWGRATGLALLANALTASLSFVV